MLLLKVCALLALVLSPAAILGQAAGSKLVCYYAPASFLSPSMVPPDLCDVIIFAFGVIDGVDVRPAHSGDVNTWAELTAKKKSKPALQVMLSLQSNFSSMVGPDVSAMTKFAINAVTFLRTYDFDGVDFDWEFPKPNQRKDYASFLSIFRRITVQEAALSGKPVLLISMALSNSRSHMNSAYDIQVINSVVDFVTIMAYDFHLFLKKVDNTTGYNSPLAAPKGESKYFSVSGIMEGYSALGLDRSKTLMGVPAYGRSYTLADPGHHGLHAPAVDKGAPGPVHRLRGVYTYPDTCVALKAGATPVWDKSIGAKYLYQNLSWVAFDDVATFDAKVTWMRSAGYAGVGVWSLALDDTGNYCGQGALPLVSALRKMLHF